MQAQGEAAEISRLFSSLGLEIHDSAVDKGFWDFGSIDASIGRARTQLQVENQVLINMIVAQKLCLIHAEVSEALEAVRDTKPNQIPKSVKIPPFTLVEEELADIVIRVLDLAEFIEADVGGAIIAKLQANKKRAFRHGREF